MVTRGYLLLVHVRVLHFARFVHLHVILLSTKQLESRLLDILCKKIACPFDLCFCSEILFEIIFTFSSAGFQGDPSSTVPSPSPSWPSRCGMSRTWCAQLTHDMGSTWQHQPCSVGRWAPRRWTSRCWMCRTRTRPTSWSGSRTTWIVNLIFFYGKMIYRGGWEPPLQMHDL